MWNETRAWERAAAADVDQWDKEVDIESLTEASKIWSDNPEGAFAIYSELAEQGSIYAMIELGNCYGKGHGTLADFDMAYEWHNRAIEYGSWFATLNYADVLFEHEYFDECEKELEDGIASEFMPAFFWLAWYRIQRNKSRSTFRAVRPLLERAASEGHLAAKHYFAAYMAMGRFGFMEMRTGFRMLRQLIDEIDELRKLDAASDNARNDSVNEPKASGIVST
jgi:hypothetical protein